MMRALLGAPYRDSHGREAVGDALWLYAWLVAIVNTSGHVCRTRASLAKDIGATDAEIETWIERLEDSKLIQVLTPSPYLALKLRSWPREARDTSQMPMQFGPSRAEQRNVPVGSSLLLLAGKANASNAGKQGVDGGAGEGEGLLAEAQAVVAAPDVSSLRELVAKHPPERIRDALARVSRTPPGQIRKSRLALFRYLLAQPPQPSLHDPDPPHQP
jgi:hypothetical protein